MNLSEVLLIASTAALACLLAKIPTASGLDCFTDFAATQSEDCGMHTGCMKKFVIRTQRTVSRSCYLTPGKNDTCFTDDQGYGVCYCHSDLCNTAGPSTTSASLAVLVSALAAAFIAGSGSGATAGPRRWMI